MDAHRNGSDPISVRRTNGAYTTQLLSAPRSEAILIRSHDHQWAYDIHVDVLADGGEPVYQNRYFLLPGQTKSECNVAPDGEYTVRVTLDNDRTREIACRLGDRPDETLVIEVGNGCLSLTDGVLARP